MNFPKGKPLAERETKLENTGSFFLALHHPVTFKLEKRGDIRGLGFRGLGV